MHATVLEALRISACDRGDREHITRPASQIEAMGEVEAQ